MPTCRLWAWQSERDGMTRSPPLLSTRTGLLQESSKLLSKTRFPALLDTLNEVTVVEQLRNALSSSIKLTIKWKNTNTEENQSLTEKYNWCVGDRNAHEPAFTRFSLCVCSYKCGREPKEVKSLAVEHHTGAVWTSNQNKNQQQNTPLPQTSYTQSHLCFGRVSQWIYPWHFGSFTFSDSNITWPRGTVTGLGGRGGTGWQSPPVPFLVKHKLSTETYAIPFLIALYSSYHWVILHTYPQLDSRLLKWYNPIS